MASATEIWDSAIFSEAASAPPPIRTRIGSNMRRRTDGQMQVMTARNVALTPPQCPTTEAPGPYFQKEFFHNGYIKSLKQLVHFYNTRDVYPYQRHLGTLPGGNDGKGELLADARGPEQHRHDDRQSRLDGSGGEPDRRLFGDTRGRLHNPLPRHQYLYRSMHVRWYGIDPGQYVPHPYSAAAALRIGDL